MSRLLVENDTILLKEDIEARNLAINLDPNKMTVAEYVKVVWKIVHQFAQLYGFGYECSMFREGYAHWNLWNLNDDLMIERKHAERILSRGVNRPSVFHASNGSLFVWHVVDYDFASINYLHRGVCKIWYFVEAEDTTKFEDLMERLYKNRLGREMANCPNKPSHKLFVIQPSVLTKHGIKFNMMVQERGDYIIVMPKIFHCGINMGDGSAEAVNFMLPIWTLYKEIHIPCTCDFIQKVVLDVERYMYLKAQLGGGTKLPVQRGRPFKKVVPTDSDEDLASLAKVRTQLVSAQSIFALQDVTIGSTSRSLPVETAVKPMDTPQPVVDVIQPIAAASGGSIRSKLKRIKGSYECSFCSRPHRDNDALNAHLASRHGGRKLSCSDCSAKFSSVSAFNRHRRTYLHNES